MPRELSVVEGQFFGVTCQPSMLSPLAGFIMDRPLAAKSLTTLLANSCNKRNASRVDQLRLDY